MKKMKNIVKIDYNEKKSISKGENKERKYEE